MKTKINSKFTIVLMLMMFFLLGTSNVFAVANSDKAASAAATAVANEQAKITSLKQRGNKEIERRLASLTTLTTKINGLKRLSTSQKTQFVNQIQSNITELTNLKAKISADTDLATLKADIQSIKQSYRIYAIFIPKIHLLAATGAASEIATNLSTLADKLNTRITAAENNGADVTSLKANLTDMRAKIKEAQDSIAQVEPTIISAIPDGYPGNKTALQSSRATLSEIKKDLTAAKQDATKIVQGLKAIKNVNTNKTNSNSSAE